MQITNAELCETYFDASKDLKIRLKVKGSQPYISIHSSRPLINTKFYLEISIFITLLLITSGLDNSNV